MTEIIGKIWNNDEIQNVKIEMQDGKISAIEPVAESEATDHYILPGFLELHTHGAVGVDVNNATTEDLMKVGKFFASKGVTGWLCSILTDTQEKTEWCIEQASKVVGKNYGGATLLGIHLEGPCLSVDYKGAMPESLLMKEADIELFKHYQNLANGNIKYVTLSAEIDGVVEIIPQLNELGIKVAIGHSGATYEKTMECIKAGAVAGTHVGNAMRLFHHHEPGVWGALMQSDCYCEAICDGLHLAPSSVKLYEKIKGTERLLGVTDSIMAAGLPDGEYMLGVNEVVVKNGDARLKHADVRAGSTLTMDRALRNYQKFTGTPFYKAVQIMSNNPAAMMEWPSKGAIEVGKDADIVLVNEDCEIMSTIINGEEVYANVDL